MSDGIGSDIDAKLSGEDFLTLNGKAHKLDLTVDLRSTLQTGVSRLRRLDCN